MKQFHSCKLTNTEDASNKYKINSQRCAENKARLPYTNSFFVKSVLKAYAKTRNIM